jgi:hypothetical protein|tara:strand:+ start:1256 stop:2695 length:1440 start_codon:yes stop_codon:yes gene_type:complete
MKQELKNIVNKLDSNNFYIDLPNNIDCAIYLNFIRVDIFDSFFRKFHKDFNETKKVTEQKRILNEEIIVYKALKKHLRKLINGIGANKTKITLNYNPELKENIESVLTSLFKLKPELDFNDKIKTQTLRKLELQFQQSNQAIFELENYQFSTYQFEDFLGSNFYLRFPKESIIYKEINITSSKYGSSIISKDKSQKKDKNDLLNILSFLQASPNFLLTNNKYFNDKLSTIYNEFDILDLLTLTSKRFFNNPKNEFKSVSTPILKLYKNTNFTILPEINEGELFNLYHSSLKQIEPLPRCVFLFRIVEYGKNYHYQKIFKSDEIDLKDVIEYYYEKLINHKFIPIYFLDYGSNRDPKTGSMTKKRKTQYRNLITELKKKSKELIKTWQTHNYLKSKSLGEIIYNTGRNTVAHGGNGKQNINYDYDNKYKHINDVNVFLELIARYLIEIHNPKLKNIVHRQKGIYELNCSHMKMIKKENNG